MSSGSSVDISVVAGGAPTDIIYRWFRNGAVLIGQTSSTFRIQSVNTTDVGIYECIPSNSLGTANSSNTTISVSCKPFF